MGESERAKETDINTSIEQFRSLTESNGLSDEKRSVYPKIGFSRDEIFDLFISKSISYSVNDDDYVIRWLTDRIVCANLKHEIIPLKKVADWSIDTANGNISHKSGRFFSLIGLMIRHRCGTEEVVWNQPIIDQPEVGILGILAKKFQGVLHFCLQAKEEPGNINLVQLSPTVQATYSNYTMAHGGKKPHFIDLFLNPPEEKVLFSKLQAEDGGRFLFKANKNMVIIADDHDINEIPGNFIWLTLRQISRLLEKDNVINSCARSVLACLL